MLFFLYDQKFNRTAQETAEQLEKDYKKTQTSYNDVVKFFGEDPARTEASEFFSIFNKFALDYQKALKENEAYAQKLVSLAKGV